ncbi:hypothetical protein J1N35_011077 [Gossypium stocksii]|uniref:Uncharacterized protein n=1 Tax=Gossypium stocksii TaxID=47602 RepID=A0A9D4ACZ0_9ROSI|nr:hypothetical protein J1N35_011077 [Gossypium stocksii]
MDGSAFWVKRHKRRSTLTTPIVEDYHFVSTLGPSVLTFPACSADILYVPLGLLDTCLRITRSFLILGLASSTSSAPVSHDSGLLVRLAILLANTVHPSYEVHL